MTTKPLTGFRMLDLADESGIYGTKLLADLGAEVIRIEPPKGDKLRRRPPFHKNRVETETSLYFTYMNSNKRSVTLDLQCAEGQELFRDLAKRADVVFETFPRSYLAERGVGYADLSKLNPGLIWVALTPFGQTGPRRDWKGSNLIAWAMAGLLYCTGFKDRPPVVPGGIAPTAYFLASLNASVGILLALRARKLTGKGQLVDISAQEAATPPEMGISGFLDTFVRRVRDGNRRPASSPNGLYPCQDGYVSIIMNSPRHWIPFSEWIQERTGIEATTSAFRDAHFRVQNHKTVDEWTEALTLQYKKQDFFVEGQARGIAITAASTVADLSRDPHLAARDYWREINHPVLGKLRMPGAPYRLSKTPCVPGPAPLLGEHNEAIYCEELGLTAADLATLSANRVI